MGENGRQGHMPNTPEEAAAVLRDLGGRGGWLRFVGGGTKFAWGTPPPDGATPLSTGGLTRILEHNAGDMTAVVEAGVPLAEAQEAFAAAGQMLALDPPNPGGGATIGGVIATGDSGPLRHRYGAPRDLVLGVRAALADGSLVRSGGRVIKNVAGYDLPKLFAGSFGTLGLLVEVVVRLHPLPAVRRTAVGRSSDPDALGRAASNLGGAPLELESLDVRWDHEGGRLFARAAGATAGDRAARAVDSMRGAGLEAAVEEADADLWDGQRSAQRSDAGAVVRVSCVRSEGARVLHAADREGATAVGRAGLGLWWVTLPAGASESLVSAIAGLRASLHPRPCVILDAPADVRTTAGVWGDPGPQALMRRVKERFDPNGSCNPGIFVGGI